MKETCGEKMHSKILTFVIPVYNVETYIGECLESILGNGCQEQYEIILVDDGSLDRSGDICDAYAAANSNIRVIHKENGGAACARNAGLKIANGKYVAFVDADDRITEGCLEKVISMAEKGDFDICFLDAIKFYPDGRVESLGDNIDSAFVTGKNKESVLEYLASRPKYSGSSCTKLFRLSFLLDNQLYFPHGGRVGEDLAFCLDCFLKASRFEALDVRYYEYRQQREGSATSSVNKKTFDGISAFIEESVNKITVNDVPKDEMCSCAMSWIAYEFSILIWQYSQLPGNEKRETIKFLHRYKWVLKYARNLRAKIVRTVTSLAGIRLTSFLLRVYMKVR